MLLRIQVTATKTTRLNKHATEFLTSVCEDKMQDLFILIESKSD
jgi:hypothetical protein